MYKAATYLFIIACILSITSCNGERSDRGRIEGGEVERGRDADRESAVSVVPGFKHGDLKELPKDFLKGCIYYLEKTGEPKKYEVLEYDLVNKTNRSVARLKHTPGCVIISEDGEYLFYNVRFSVKQTGFYIMYRENRKGRFHEIRYYEMPTWAIDGPALIYDEKEDILFVIYEVKTPEGGRGCLCKGGISYRWFCLKPKDGDLRLRETMPLPFFPVKFTEDYVYVISLYAENNWLIKYSRTSGMEFHISNVAEGPFPSGVSILNDDETCLFTITKRLKEGYKTYLYVFHLCGPLVHPLSNSRVVDITDFGFLTTVYSPNGMGVLIEPSPYWAEEEGNRHYVYVYDVGTNEIYQVFDYYHKSSTPDDATECVAWLE
jgi:hypothetical protein